MESAFGGEWSFNTIYASWIWGFASDLEIISPKCAHLLNLTDQILHLHQFTEKHSIGEQIFFSGNGASR